MVPPSNEGNVFIMVDGLMGHSNKVYQQKIHWKWNEKVEKIRGRNYLLRSAFSSGKPTLRL